MGKFHFCTLPDLTPTLLQIFLEPDDQLDVVGDQAYMVDAAMITKGSRYGPSALRGFTPSLQRFTRPGTTMVACSKEEAS